VPQSVAAAGGKGAAAAIIMAAGLGHVRGAQAEGAERAARATGLRLVGPNCLGVLVPQAHFDGSFATRMLGKGHLAVISQFGAIVAGTIEAAQRIESFDQNQCARW
jgi:acetyltransferase